MSEQTLIKVGPRLWVIRCGSVWRWAHWDGVALEDAWWSRSYLTLYGATMAARHRHVAPSLKQCRVLLDNCRRRFARNPLCVGP